MKEVPYIVGRTEGRWTIRCSGRTFDKFEDKDDAILTALIQAESARRQGRPSRVVVEERGRARGVWGDEPSRDRRSPGSRPHS